MRIIVANLEEASTYNSTKTHRVSMPLYYTVSWIIITYF